MAPIKDDEEEEEIIIDPEEVDETLAIINDPEFDEWADAGQIRCTDPGKDDEPDDEDDNDQRDTEPIKIHWWWPF